jgi:hypothetical protein
VLSFTEFFAAHDIDVLDMKCEQRDAFIDGKMCVPQIAITSSPDASALIRGLGSSFQATLVLHGGSSIGRRAWEQIV